MIPTINKNMKEYTCLNCGAAFNAAGSGRHTYCSEFCKNQGSTKYRIDSIARSKLDQNTGVEGIDFVTCLICGERSKRLYGKHFNERHNGLTKSEYQLQFPEAKVACDKDNETLNKTRGKWMQTPAHRKRQSEKISGTANPMSKANTTELQRKQSSPFSIEFWKKRFPNETLEELNTRRSIEVKKFLSDRVVATSIQYYLNLGLSEEEAKLELSNKQSTFTLAKCIKKHGEKQGLEVWTDRQKRWKNKVFNDKTYIGRGFSKVSDAFINTVIDKLKILNPDILLQHGSNEKFITDPELNRVYKYDLTTNDRKIIEFNGDYWHCNPIKYESDYYHKVKKKTAAEIWEYDCRKIEIASKYNYSVKVIWEADYNKDPEKTVEECLKFLK
jgi:hypothetical protein